MKKIVGLLTLTGFLVCSSLSYAQLFGLVHADKENTTYVLVEYEGLNDIKGTFRALDKILTELGAKLSPANKDTKTPQVIQTTIDETKQVRVTTLAYNKSIKLECIVKDGSAEDLCNSIENKLQANHKGK
jgi:hypothetical protein